MSASHGVARIESFSDAVFAFALTLLVVSLEVPKEMDDLRNLVRGFLPFALMFAMVCWIWYQHSVFFRRYGLDDPLTVALNCALLFVVLFYVYPLKFLTMGGLGPLVGMRDTPRVSDPRTLMLLYNGGVIAIFGLFVLLYGHAWRRRASLHLTPDDEIILRYARRAHLGMCAIGLGSIAILLLFSGDLHFYLAGYIYFLVGPLQAVNGASAGRARRRLAEHRR